jgi:hypothetical protein
MNLLNVHHLDTPRLAMQEPVSPSASASASATPSPSAGAQPGTVAPLFDGTHGAVQLAAVYGLAGRRQRRQLEQGGPPPPSRIWNDPESVFGVTFAVPASSG